METVHCDLCGLDAPTLFLKIPDYLLDRPQIVSTLVRCANCGLIYQNPRPSLAEIGAHYPEEYDSYNSEASIGGSALRQRAVRYGL
ncbi:MAG: hypothetical protein R3335_11340, partial [Anaerolineales bacterium]|nr:hypothetical protein [Anaerolineales bacterium]